MTKRVRTYSLILLASLALGILPLLYLLYEGIDPGRLDPHDHEIQNLLTYFLLLLFSYYNHTVFVPAWYLTRRYSRYVVVSIGCILAVTLIPQRIEQWVFLKPPTELTPLEWIAQILWRENLFPPHHEGPAGDRPPPGWERSPPRPERSPRERRPPHEERIPYLRGGEGAAQPLSIKFSIIFLLCSVSALISISVQTANRLQQLEVDKLQAELGQLKAQIHPHFLFNTLNSIYALAIRKDDKTADTVVKLAEFMRYMIREAGSDWVPLEKELAYIQNYLDLQQTRLRDSVQVSYTVEGSVKGHQIAPLILFAFIENAFKHGVNPDEDSRIRIAIQVDDNRLHMLVRNRNVTIRNADDDTGLGLPNTQTRLDLLYPRRYVLIIDDQPEEYGVELIIQFS